MLLLQQAEVEVDHFMVVVAEAEVSWLTTMVLLYLLKVIQYQLEEEETVQHQIQTQECLEVIQLH
jgi:hypothetical protein